MSDYEARYAAALDELERLGVWPSNAAPLEIRIRRRLGLKPRPYYYAGIWQIILSSGIWFGAVWGLFMWLFVWRPAGLPFETALLGAALAGAIFGVVMALVYGRKRKKLNLSAWDDLDIKG